MMQDNPDSLPPLLDHLIRGPLQAKIVGRASEAQLVECVACVYFILDGERIIRIGLTTNIIGRIRAYLGCTDYKFDRVLFSELGCGAKMCALEEFAIKLFEPEKNTQFTRRAQSWLPGCWSKPDYRVLELVGPITIFDFGDMESIIKKRLSKKKIISPKPPRVEVQVLAEPPRIEEPPHRKLSKKFITLSPRLSSRRLVKGLNKVRLEARKTFIDPYSGMTYEQMLAKSPALPKRIFRGSK